MRRVQRCVPAAASTLFAGCAAMPATPVSATRPAAPLLIHNVTSVSTSPLWTARRHVSTVVDSRTFETEVMQSRRAVVCIFHIPTATCSNFVSTVESIADGMAGPNGSSQWLKVCSVNADENPNLASVFSVERGKLPVTYFVYQTTIIDKVKGPVPRARIEAIIHKFHEYYLKQQGTDVSTTASDTGKMMGADLTPLTDATPTHQMQANIMAALVGAERITLPKDADKLEGLKALIQKAKKQAIYETRALYNSLGMDVKRLSDEEVATQYHGTPTYMSAAIISALEVLYLARVCGAASNIRPADVRAAMEEFEGHFGGVMSDATIRKITGLAEMAVTRYEACCTIEDIVNIPETEFNEVEGEAKAAFWRDVVRWADDLDFRLAPESFPAATADELFAVVKTNVIRAKKDPEAKRRLEAARVCLLALIYQLPTDSSSIAARSRLASMMF